MNRVELGQVLFNEAGLVPVVVQRVSDGRVLMLAYASRRAVELTMETGWAHFHSRSRNALWKKGESSGNTQQVREILVDCDGDALLYRVQSDGPACHTGEPSCFFRRLWGDGRAGAPAGPEILAELFEVIESRKAAAPEGSYVHDLLVGEWEMPLRKIGEEATEVMLAAATAKQADLPAEIADLWFHCLVLLSRCSGDLEEVLQILHSRRQ
ncbi:MAG: bifunctional phosphoribosyl-AMP cyclohydrolase/phosphoribosyl-ATP diphosphatase HisIE [Bacillota bacterium]